MQVIFIDNYFRTIYLDFVKKQKLKGYVFGFDQQKYYCDFCLVKQKSACQNFTLIGFTLHKSIDYQGARWLFLPSVEVIYWFDQWLIILVHDFFYGKPEYMDVCTHEYTNIIG